MVTLMSVYNQWARRPAEERFVSVDDLADHLCYVRNNSEQYVIGNDDIVIEADGDKLLTVAG